MSDQAAGLRERRSAAGASNRVAIVSGKGGVGKTNVAANLAVVCARAGRRVLLVDGDLGLANVDVLLGLVPEYCAADVLDRRCRFADATLLGPAGIEILPAAGGDSRMATLQGSELARFERLLRENTAQYDLVLVDAGAGVGHVVLGLAALCQRALVVTNAEPTTLADAYALIKLLRREARQTKLDLVVNAAQSPADAARTHSRIERMTQRFLGEGISLLGHLVRDDRLGESVARQRAVVDLYPNAPISQGLVALAQNLVPTEPEARPRKSVAEPPSNLSNVSIGEPLR